MTAKANLLAGKYTFLTREGRPKCIPMLTSLHNHPNQPELETHHGLFTTTKTQFIPDN